jgi:hypothetical protein
MRIAWDTETHLIQPGEFAPPMVCLQYSIEGAAPQILTRDDAIPLVTTWLHDPTVTLIGHNVWFDLAVIARHIDMRLIFAKIDAGLIADTMLRHQMIDVAEGRLKYHVDEDTGEVRPSTYSLAALVWRLFKKRLPKEDTWRLRYKELDGIPLKDWPEDAVTYALRDASETWNVFAWQERYLSDARWAQTEIDGWAIRRSIPDVLRQNRAAWALHCMSREGVRTDPEAVQSLKRTLSEEFSDQMLALRPTGLLRVEAARKLKSGPRKGTPIPELVTRDMEAIYARVRQAYRGNPPLTESGRVATDKKTLKQSGDEDLELLARMGGTQKLLTTYLPILDTADPIHCRYNVVMETGRTSASGPNMQNPPRAGGIRECFVARPGHALCFSDYDTLELRALAQTCLDVLGRSEMAEALRRGEDLHLSLAAAMLGIPLVQAVERLRNGDPVIKEYRQQAKPANFGFPGGMQPESFREYAEGYGIKLSSADAQKLYTAWRQRWTEMPYYFNWVKTLPDPLKMLPHGMVRGGASYTAACNGFFQGRAAAGAKEALWRVCRESYLPAGGSALYGAKPVLFLHDEIGIEVPLNNVHEAGERLAMVMREAMATVIPDVPITCKPVACRRWYKGAEPVYVNGRLVPCKPEGKKWIADI